MINSDLANNFCVESMKIANYLHIRLQIIIRISKKLFKKKLDKKTTKFAVHIILKQAISLTFNLKINNIKTSELLQLRLIIVMLCTRLNNYCIWIFIS